MALSALRRLAGALLLAAAYAPLHRLLDPQATGPAGAATRAATEAAWSGGIHGSLIVLGAAWVVARTPVADRMHAAAVAALRWAADVPAPRFAALVGALAFLLSAAAARLLFGAAPTSVDEMVQLLHARTLASGSLSLALPADPAAWSVQNGIHTPVGWASVYPPGHTLALALGIRAGSAWLVGPLALALATALSAAGMERLLGDRKVARAAAALLAVTPFWILLGATHLSHVGAAAGLAGVLWCGLRARDGSWAWSLAAGAAVGWAVLSRPWTGVVLSVALLGALWSGPWLGGAWSARARLARLGGLLAGGTPFAAALFAWNTRLFGHPLRLGYEEAFGPAHGLGWHADPWGNRYGPLEAVAYSGADLVQLGSHLFESPLPALAVVGVAFLTGPLGRGSRTLTAWALGGVAANALYWHHGLHMGPRMLYETIPAWVALFVLSASSLCRPARPAWLRRSATAVVGISLALSAALAPLAVRSYAAGDTRAVALPDPLPAPPALVFVHGSWPSRIAARLAAAGMRRDSIETVLRRNDVCTADRYARWREQRSGSAPPDVDLEPRPGSPASLSSYRLATGTVVRVREAGAFDEGCRREAHADRVGTIELEPLLWRRPPLPGSSVVLARDLGPARNAAVAAAFGARAYLLVAQGPDGARLLEYDDGMEWVWGGAAGAAPGGP